jgi:hypothetical protein
MTVIGEGAQPPTAWVTRAANVNRLVCLYGNSGSAVFAWMRFPNFSPIRDVVN